MDLPLDKPYNLMALFLAPRKSEETLQALRNALTGEKLDLGALLYTANLHMVTPLWYVRLRQDGLLPLLPEDLGEYLTALHQANCERNDDFRRELARFLSALKQVGIEALLLKGAATFCDDLYGDPGARMMGDLDILVPGARAEEARRILEQLGYEEVPDPAMAPEGLETDGRHHQLPRYRLPETPVAIEIHFKVSYAQAGRVLPVETAWSKAEPSSLGSTDTLIFEPTWRLLHNTAHALVPHCEYIRGMISLAQLAEFAAIADRFCGRIDWARWLESGRFQGLGGSFIAYLTLACRLMKLEGPSEISSGRLARLRCLRIADAGNRNARMNPSPSLPGLFHRLHYYARLPLWSWQNVAYAQGWQKVPLRLRYLLKKLLNAKTRSKIPF